MPIIETDYTENDQIILEQLAEYADTVAPEMFDQVEKSMFLTKPNKPISLAYTKDDVVLGRIVGHIDYHSELLKTEGLAIEKEALAMAEGCSLGFVETVSISAPQFYEKKAIQCSGKQKIIQLWES